MKRLNKKSYMRTIEALIAILIIFIFLIFTTQRSNVEKKSVRLDILSQFEDDINFRDCVLDNNLSCVDNNIKPYIPKIYKYKIDILNETNVIDVNVNEKDVIQESLFLFDNTTGGKKIVRLYYWTG